jgi:hypothetical protein
MAATAEVAEALEVIVATEAWVVPGMAPVVQLDQVVVVAEVLVVETIQAAVAA